MEDRRYCEYCVHCEEVHGLERVVLICSHRPGYRGLWVAVASSLGTDATGGAGACVRFKEMGDPSSLFELRRDKQDDNDGVRLVPLSQGKFALVEAGDYAGVMRYSWYAAKSYAKSSTPQQTPSPLRGTPPFHLRFASKRQVQGESFMTWYAVRKDGGRTIRMHREILKAGPGEVVDHINHDGLDNRRFNLRVCSHAENGRNQRGQAGRSSRYKGVSRDRRLGKWRAQIWHDGEHRYLGLFESEDAAAEAYNAKARELFGEFAYLNKVP